MDNKSLLVGVVITTLLFTSIGGVVFGYSQMQNANNQAEPTQAATPTSTATPEPVDESNVSQDVLDSKPGATALKQNFQSKNQYESRVFIQRDGQVVLSYTSDASGGTELKSEMKEIALLYADVAADNPNTGALTIRANGVLLTVPADSAIAHGNGDINEEAYFKTVRFDSVSAPTPEGEE
jgi:uncharacterized iron-regulated membrane protein